MKKTGISELRISRLPTPSIHYQPFLPIEPDCSICALALLGESKINILLFLDEAGNTSIYNTELSSLTATPILNSPKDADCVAVSIPDSQVLLLRPPVPCLTLTITGATCSCSICTVARPVLRCLATTLWGSGAGVSSHHRHSWRTESTRSPS